MHTAVLREPKRTDNWARQRGALVADVLFQQLLRGQRLHLLQPQAPPLLLQLDEPRLVPAAKGNLTEDSSSSGMA